MPHSHSLETLLQYGLLLFIFLIPLETRWIVHQGILRGEPWEYGTMSLYATDILFFILAAITLLIIASRLHAFSLKTPLLLIGATGFLSIIVSDKPGLSLYGALRLGQGLFLAAMIAKSSLRVSSIASVVIASSVIQSILSVLQGFTQSVVGSKWFGIAVQDPSVSGTSVVETATDRFLRAYGSFPHPNILGEFLSVGLLLTVALYLRALKPLERSLLLIAAIMITTGNILTFSRSAWLGFLLGLSLLITLVFWRSSSFVRRNLLMMSTVILTTFFLHLSLFPDLLLTRFSPEAKLETRSIEERERGYRDAFRLLKNHGIAGVGIQTFADRVRNEVDARRPGLAYQPLHNAPLLILTETGIAGLLAFLILITSILKGILKNLRNLPRGHLPVWTLVSLPLLTTILLPSFADHYSWTLVPGILLFWSTIGLVSRGLDSF